MKKFVPATIAALALWAGTLSAQGAPAPAAQPSPHVMIRLDEVKWRGDNKSLASAVLEGNPATPDAPYSLLVRIPDGQWINPHWHPRDKHVLVISGTLLMGAGDKINAGAVTALPAGSYSLVPATTHHYEGGRGETIVLFYGTGPLTTNTIPQDKP